MNKNRIFSLVLIVIFALLGWGLYVSQTNPNSWVGRFPFILGLDLNGGTELVYQADVSKISSADIGNSLEALRDVIETRVNSLGITEPIVQFEKPSTISGKSEYRLIVQLPGVTEIEKAVKLIGETPLLEFKLVSEEKSGVLDINPVTKKASMEPKFVATKLTGRFLKHAAVEFNPTTGQAIVSITFNQEGGDIFADITSKNIGKQLAIFLDGKVISAPVIREEIADGKAQISGDFTPQEAKSLVKNLNLGALPVPINIVGKQVVGPTLGEAALKAGVKAGVVGFLLVVLFLILWYRLPGLIASVALVTYIILSLVVFKLVHVTLTAAGIAGFILSIGMAVDANILIFERMKEERLRGKNLPDALREGFKRAWLSIRDSNISSIITAAVLFWVGTSSVRGFAFTFGLGVLISMFTAITVSRNFLLSVTWSRDSKFRSFLFGAGIKNSKQITS